jgi:hypothetical protein
MSSKKSIPNPNRLTSEEKQFLHAQPSNIAAKANTHIAKPGYKNIMVSMPYDFLSNVDSYLKNNPTEGSRSSLIVRVVAEYLRSKTNIY